MSPTPTFQSTPRQVVSAKSSGRAVPLDVIERIYHAVETPYKYGIVLQGDNAQSVDSPSVFRYNDTWFMVYIQFTDNRGYETLLAQSGDLLTWNTLGKILEFSGQDWDACQAAGGPALHDTR